MTDVVPAIIPESFDDLTQHVSRVHTMVPRVQVDIANGTYASTRTWPYEDSEHFAALVSQDEGLPFWEDVSYEIDMMVSDPETILDDWITLGASSFVIHIESTRAYEEIAEKTAEMNVELGWAIKPSTPTEELFEIIEHVGMPQFVQVMGSDSIGRSGVELDEDVYEKVREIRAMYGDLPIAVDIGVNEETAPELIEAGVTKLVAGSAIFNAEDVEEAIEILGNL